MKSAGQRVQGESLAATEEAWGPCIAPGVCHPCCPCVPPVWDPGSPPCSSCHRIGCCGIGRRVPAAVPFICSVNKNGPPSVRRAQDNYVSGVLTSRRTAVGFTKFLCRVQGVFRGHSGSSKFTPRWSFRDDVGSWALARTPEFPSHLALCREPRARGLPSSPHSDATSPLKC